MFKESFKYYKSRNPPPNYDDVIDFYKIDDITDDKILSQINNIKIDENDNQHFFGLTPPSQWKIYELKDRPGLIFIQNPFTQLGHKYWPVRCLKEYTKKPNKSNLDPFNLIPENDEWWDLCQKHEDISLLEKLRWVTLGYHHNWDTKVYDENIKNDFPNDLAGLVQYLANIIFGNENFKAEAAILNFYHLDSTLAGHTDHSEKNLEAPLFSLSFGQSAVFLIGGKSKEEKPTAIFLRSGDIVIMSKEARLSYHGVPRILKDDTFKKLYRFDSNISCRLQYISSAMVYSGFIKIEDLNISMNDALFKPFEDYLSRCRINLNIRQVL